MKTVDSDSGAGAGPEILQSTFPKVVPTPQTYKLPLGRGCSGHHPSPLLHPLLFIFPTYKSQCQHIRSKHCSLESHAVAVTTTGPLMQGFPPCPALSQSTHLSGICQFVSPSKFLDELRPRKSRQV